MRKAQPVTRSWHLQPGLGSSLGTWPPNMRDLQVDGVATELEESRWCHRRTDSSVCPCQENLACVRVPELMCVVGLQKEEARLGERFVSMDPERPSNSS